MPSLLPPLAVLLLASACIADVETPFPEGVEPWEVNTAPAPPGTADEPFPEELAYLTGDSGDYLWFHGRGYLPGSVEQVWEALKDPAVMANRRGVDSWTPRLDVEEGFDLSLAIDNVVNDVITLEWTNTWRHALVDTDADKPAVVGVRYQKTDGSALIALMRGSIVLRQTEQEDRTAIELIEHLGAPLVTDADLLCYQQDLFDELALKLRGLPLPEYSENCR